MNVAVTKLDVGVGSVAVIVPVYNRQSTVLPTLDSIIEQSLSPDRLIVVDDGSTDGTVEAVESFLSQHAGDIDWVLLRQSNKGPSSARAAGLRALVEHAPSYVCFLDSDDRWPADFLQRSARALSDDPGAVAVTADRRYLCEDGFVPQSVGGADVVSNPIRFFIAHGAGVTSSTMVRYAAVAECGGWEEGMRHSEDTLFFSKLSTLGHWIHSPGEPVDFHLGNAAKCGEEGNLSQIAPDRYFRWAVLSEKIFFILKSQKNGFVPDRCTRAAVCRRWTMAGKQCNIAGNSHAEAISFARAFRWEATFKSFRKFLRAWFRCLGRAPTEEVNRFLLPFMLWRREVPDLRLFCE